MAKVNVEVAAPLEQLPRDCDALTSITGQSTVLLATVEGVSPVKLFDAVSYTHLTLPTTMLV